MPKLGDVHVNKPLTNISIAHLQAATEFAAAQVFPVVPVQKQSDRYFQYNKGDLLRTEAQIRAPATESAGVDYDIDNTPSYSCDKYALHMDVDEDLKANADAPLSPERDAARILTQKLLIKRDLLFAESFFSDGVWDADWDGVAASPSTNEVLQWDADDSHPIQDVDNLREAIAASCGRRPNVIVIGPAVFNVVKNHADILDRIKHTSRDVVTLELLAMLFEVDRVLCPGAIYNSSVKGQTASYGRIYGKDLLMCYKTSTPALMEPTAGYIFSWAGLIGAGNEGLRSKRLEVPLKNAVRIENEFAYDMKVVSTDCGGFIKDVIG